MAHYGLWLSEEQRHRQNLFVYFLMNGSQAFRYFSQQRDHYQAKRAFAVVQPLKQREELWVGLLDRDLLLFYLEHEIDQIMLIQIEQHQRPYVNTVADHRQS